MIGVMNMGAWLWFHISGVGALLTPPKREDHNLALEIAIQLERVERQARAGNLPTTHLEKGSWPEKGEWGTVNRTSGRSQLTAYLRVRQHPRKFLNPRSGNFCVADVHPFECGETVKVFQTRVGNLNAVQIQILDLRQPR